MGSMVNAYERIGTISIHEALKAIGQRRPVEYDGITCHTASPRLLTYHVHGVTCCVPGCTISGQFFAIERAVNQKTAQYHLNLYGLKSGQEIMITSDHRIPKSRGGSNALSNRQPMCAPHNFSKGNQLIHL